MYYSNVTSFVLCTGNVLILFSTGVQKELSCSYILLF